jgi:2-methylcitrate dehydratase PrpD
VRKFKPEPFQGLGQDWLISSGGLKFKLAPIMGMGQPVLAAVKDLIQGGELDGREVARVLVESSDRIFLSDVGYPANSGAARASVPFLVAAAIVHQEEFLDDRHLVRFVRQEFIDDPRVRQLASRVELRADPATTATMESGPKRTLDARVSLDLRDGSALSAYHEIWPEVSALSYEDIASKFRAATEGRLSRERAERLIAEVADVDHRADVADLARLLK